ncbi:MAG: chromosomal replication initiator protein DnaA [Gemmatimonadota bacterium]|nr:chromosomal replication initiator protein DnaA [Gemmatimonadota bacterium]
MMELTAPELWLKIQEVARASVPEHSFKTWIASATAVATTADELIIEAQNPFHVEWLEDKFGHILDSAAEQVLGRPLKVSVRAAARPDPLSIPSVELPASSHDQPAPAPNQAPAGDTSRPAVPRPPLNERYTFDRFVVGANNQLAAAACRAVADTPARMYNPLFLYGGVGLGKTHLMHAIGNHLLEQNPESRIAYISSEKFTNELVASIREGRTSQFRRRYRDMDLLLVDDVHFLEGKESTQEEFFHTFNALYDARRQIVLTSDRPPKEMARLEERLVSRFEWGLVVDLRPPDFETRIAILRKKADDDGLSMDDEIIEFIASSCTSSVRELEGAVIKLLAYSSLTHQEITLDLARTALRGVLGRSDASEPAYAPETIRNAVARRWHVRTDALASKRRTKDLTVPRQVAMYLIKELLGMSLVRIGELFGGRDHSTVIHSIRKVEERMERDETFRKDVESTRREVTESSGHGV